MKSSSSTSRIVITRTVGQTRSFGRALAKKLSPGQVLALTGELGAGKTCLAQGIAAGLGVGNAVASPTFTLIAEHRGRKLPFYHIDLYRLDSPAQVLAIGIEEYLDSDGITVIEWAEKISDLLPRRTIRIHLKILRNGHREISCASLPLKRPVRSAALR